MLLVALGVCTYRDVLPLFLRDHEPADAADGVFLWVKLALLVGAAVVIPLLNPRVYKPYNPKVRFPFLVFGQFSAPHLHAPL